MFWSISVGKKVLMQSCPGRASSIGALSQPTELDTQEQVSGQTPQYKCYNTYPNSFIAERLVVVFTVHKICIDN